MSSPGAMLAHHARAREQYEAIENAVMESARGRWFLAEYASRNRNADTETLLDALTKLENRSRKARAEGPAPGLESLAEDIKTARSDIASVKNDMLPDAPAMPRMRQVYRASPPTPMPRPRKSPAGRSSSASSPAA